MKNIDIHIVGLGNLGTAFLDALISQSFKLYLYEQDLNLKDKIYKKYKLPVNENLNHIESGVLILCIKPQNVISFLKNTKDFISEEVLICSPVAGLQISTLNEHLKNKVIRIMPNLLIRNKNGFIPYCKNYSDDYLGFENSLLSTLGKIKEYEENHFPLITALSGSGPAWFYELANQLVVAGAKHGLDPVDAEFIVKELVKSLPNLVSKDESFHDLVMKVKSPNGTTEAGLNSLKQASFDTIIHNAIEKASQRSVEISKELENE